MYRKKVTASVMKKFIVLILLFALILEVPLAKGDATNSSILTLNKLKGICMRADDLSKIGVDKALKEIKEYGYNAIFVLAKTEEGSVIFKSQNFPVLVPALPQIIESARKYNLKVYAYFPVMMDKNYATKNPKDLMGNLGYEKNTYYVSLLSKNYINYIKLFLKELLQYDVDGIVFDYIRYPNGSYDFSDGFVSLGKANGINMDYVKSIAYKTFIKPADWKTMFTLYEQGDKDIVNWVNLRERVLKDVAEELKAFAVSIHPHLKFGAFLVSRGYRYNLINDAPSIKKSYPYQKVNFAYFGDTFKGILDFVIPMVYLSSLEETPDYAEVVADRIKELVHNTLDVYVGVNPASISFSDVTSEIYYAFYRARGVVVFRYPLFTMGRISLEDAELKKGEKISLLLENSKGEKRVETVVFDNVLLPPVKEEVVVTHYYKYFDFVIPVGKKEFFLNGERVEMDVPVVLKDGRVFVPLRFLSEAIGFKVSYEAKEKNIFVGDFLKLTVGKSNYTVEGKERKMDVAPFIENSRTYVPLRFIMEAFHLDVQWDEKNASVSVRGIIRLD